MILRYTESKISELKPSISSSLTLTKKIFINSNYIRMITHARLDLKLLEISFYSILLRRIIVIGQILTNVLLNAY